MSAFIWVIILVASLIALVKSADWVVESSEKIGLALKISPFIVGVTIVAVGTSLPELVASIAAVLKESTEIVTANIAGSNIANILLIIGISSIAARFLVVKRSLIDLDAPLLAVSTIIFLFVALDQKIVFTEGLLLIAGFIIYLLYTVFKREASSQMQPEKQPELSPKVFVFLVLGIIGLGVGANYSVESIIELSKKFEIAPSLITIIALALGTSLPELIVSAKAAASRKFEMAIGNVFGSSVFNLLLIGGIPSLITSLSVDQLTFKVAFPFLIAATFLFIISGISRKIHIWEGLLYLVLYILFLIKLVNFN